MTKKEGEAVMHRSRGYYCLIQYCPDRARAEVANMGVLLFCPERRFLNAKFASTNHRITQVFGRRTDLAQVKTAKRALINRLKLESEHFGSLDDLRAFIATRANELVITEPKTMTAGEPSADLMALAKRLLEDVDRPRRSRRSEYARVLRRTFEQLSRETNAVRSKPRFRIDELKVDIAADYLYFNGDAHLVRMQMFDSDAGRSTIQARNIGGEAVLVDKRLRVGDRQSKLIVVSTAGETDMGGGESAAAGVLGEFPVEFVRHDDIPSFAERVRNEIESHL